MSTQPGVAKRGARDATTRLGRVSLSRDWGLLGVQGGSGRVNPLNP